MASIERLRFAQMFPFTNRAKAVLRELKLSLEDVSEETMNRAKIVVSHAFKKKEYMPQIINSSDLLEQEIIAFPVSKIIISLMNEPMLFKGFASMVAKSTFAYLEQAKDRKQLALDLAEDLSIDFGIAEGSFFVSMPLEQFLSIKFRHPSLKLVNQCVERGVVLLNINLFCRFLSEFVYTKVFDDLPVKTSGLPPIYKSFASQLDSRKKTYTEAYNFKVEGKINPNAFPPCIASLYKKQLAGQSLPHMSRFFLATFLNAVGMPERSILDAFKKSPNYDEKIASYQIKRIAAQNYSPASCEKIKTYGICEDPGCNVRHPLSYYRRQLKGLAAKEKADEKKAKNEDKKAK